MGSWTWPSERSVKIDGGGLDKMKSRKFSRRIILGICAGMFAGCVNDSGETSESDDETEPELVATASKDVLELPRDTLEITLKNRGDARSGVSPNLRPYKIVDGDRYFIGPLNSSFEDARVVFLDPGEESTGSFTVDNTDRDASQHGLDQILWGLGPGTYVAEWSDTVEFEIVGDPLDMEEIETVAHEMKRDNGVLHVYADATNLDDDEASVRIVPTDADGHRLIDEQLNQFGGLRDALLHADGGKVNLYTERTISIESRLDLFTDESSDDGIFTVEYDGEAYRVEVVNED